MTHERDRRLKEVLVGAGVISQRDFEMLTAEGGSERLLAEGRISADDLARAEAHAWGLPFVQIDPDGISLDVLSILPEPIARAEGAVVFRRDGERVSVAALDPRTFDKVRQLLEENGHVLEPVLTSAATLKQVLVRYQHLLREQFGEVLRRESESHDPNAVRLVDALLSHALLQGASAVSVDPRDAGLAVRYRLGGKMYDAMMLSAKAGELVMEQVARLAGMGQSDESMSEGGFLLEGHREQARVWVSILPSIKGHRLLLRLERDLDPAATRAGFSLESLGLEGETLERLHEAVSHRGGVLLAAGPKGAGKTTFLYTLLDVLDRPDRELAVVEHTIAYPMRRAVQIASQEEHGLSYAEAVRAALRARPDVLLVGDISSDEVARLAVTAAMRGALIIAGIDAPHAAAAVTTFASLAGPRSAAAYLLGAVGMRVMPTLGAGHRVYRLSRDEANSLEKLVPIDGSWEDVPFGRQSGNSGSRRTGIYEILLMNRRLRDRVAEEVRQSVLYAEAVAAGMVPLLHSAVHKAAGRVIALEDALRYAPMPS